MAKSTKTWKIGEYCKGGIITVEITGKIITVIGKEWDFSKGTRKSSDQSGAKEWTRGTVLADDSEGYRKLYDFISDLTTHYYTEQVIDWIKTKVNLSPKWGW
jgi:DNA polymerase III alpha subunit